MTINILQTVETCQFFQRLLYQFLVNDCFTADKGMQESIPKYKIVKYWFCLFSLRLLFWNFEWCIGSKNAGNIHLQTIEISRTCIRYVIMNRWRHKDETWRLINVLPLRFHLIVMMDIVSTEWNGVQCRRLMYW